MCDRLRVRTLGVAGTRWMVKEDRLDHDMAYSPSIHVHNSRLRETPIQELVPRDISNVHYMDRVA